MATVTREKIGPLYDKISVKVDKGDYLPSFEKKLKEYGKNANIPGFRKGMVPVSMIRKMYGSAIFHDEVVRGVEKQLQSWLKEEKPDIFAQPLPVATQQIVLDHDNPGEYTFDFEIGLKPEFTLPDFSKGKFLLHKVEVTDDMLDEEINRMRIKGGNMTEPETISDEENVINVLFAESDEKGNITEGGIQKENSVLLKYFSPELQKQLQGKKKGDKITFKLKDSFPADKLEMMLHDLELDPKNEADAEKYFTGEIVKIGLVEKRELDEAFFGEVFPSKEIKSEADFRAALKTEMEQYWMSESRNQLHDQLYHFLLDNSEMDFPEAFLKRWLKDGGEKAKTDEEVEQEYPGFINQLKWTLLSDKLITENKIEVSAEDIRESMREEVSRYFGNLNMGEDTSWLDAYLDRMMRDEKQVDATYRRLITEKVFQQLEGMVKPEEKSITAEALVKMRHHHQH